MTNPMRNIVLHLTITPYLDNLPVDEFQGYHL